ncbi:hypothetical protein [Methylobacterium sp. C25]|uniref:hypothetical protein n=1 Tax=Methylobacterium sp. C25 TaxID=2721622 RepID=UPI001F1DB54E|nr:hypothetical protein [Methylobacterium sp. C25]
MADCEPKSRDAARRLADAVVTVVVGLAVAYGAALSGPPHSELAWLHGLLGGLGAAVFMRYFADAIWRR